MGQFEPDEGGPDDAEQVADYLNEKAGEFDQLCAERHEAGRQEYGELTFLGNDVLRMMLEELADTTNYCRMQAIKLLMLQEHLEQQLHDGVFDNESDIEIGFAAFKGTKETGWRKP